MYSDSRPVFIEGDLFRTVIELNEVDKKTIDEMTDKKASDKKASDKLPKHADKFIQFLKENGKITNMQGREITGLSEARVRAVFDKLSKLEIISSIGAKRNRYYVLK